MAQKSNKPDFQKLAICIFLPLFTGFIGAFLTAPAIPSWYAGLIKPSFSPPNWIFGPVWTLLYVLMGVSLYLVWQKGLRGRSASLYGTQLFLNLAWSAIFFGLKLPIYAFFEIILLWVAILLTILDFRKVSKNAALLLIPYLIWVSFAAILNFYIAILNP